MQVTEKNMVDFAAVLKDFEYFCITLFLLKRKMRFCTTLFVSFWSRSLVSFCLIPLAFFLITLGKDSMIAGRPFQLSVFADQPICISFEEKYIYINIYISVRYNRKPG